MFPRSPVRYNEDGSEGEELTMGEGDRTIVMEGVADLSAEMKRLVQSSRHFSPNASRVSPLQQLFAGASNFSISRSQINAIGRDYVDHRTVSNIDPDQLERLLAELRQAEFAYRSISEHVGYSSANGVTIIDALDERFVLPLSIVSEFEDVHDSLMKHFRGVLGEELVAEKKYRIARQHDGQLVKPEDWKKVLEAGEVVVMSMLIEKVWVKSLKDTCPKCGRTRLGSSNEGGWLKCRRCKMRYLFSTEPTCRKGTCRYAHIQVADPSMILISSSYVAPSLDPYIPLADRSVIQYVAPSLDPYIPLADRSVLLLSSVPYVILSLEPYVPLADRSVLLLSSVPYVVLSLEPYVPLADRSVLLLSSVYVVLPLEAHIPLANRFVLLVVLSLEPVYVALPLEAHIQLADRSVLLLSSVPYVVLSLEPYVPLADRSVLLLSSGTLYVVLSLEAHIPLADRSMLLLSSPTYVVLPLEAHIPLADRSALLLPRLYVVLPLEAHTPLADLSVHTQITPSRQCVIFPLNLLFLIQHSRITEEESRFEELVDSSSDEVWSSSSDEEMVKESSDDDNHSEEGSDFDDEPGPSIRESQMHLATQSTTASLRHPSNPPSSRPPSPMTRSSAWRCRSALLSRVYEVRASTRTA
ncbi:hypothetical protein D9611_012239 [Ephemerocybe angulata]|uniref:C3H1-type domain-containing protein n=1 Tax=Ephemerocybe angulata TaxID=980116 RepID=A0A8H5AUN7_9AGAR|nr:hypothetical protein D9611_012239 [Tulosesus angulatus]